MCGAELPDTMPDDQEQEKEKAPAGRRAGMKDPKVKDRRHHQTDDGDDRKRSERRREVE